MTTELKTLQLEIISSNQSPVKKKQKKPTHSHKRSEGAKGRVVVSIWLTTLSHMSRVGTRVRVSMCASLCERVCKRNTYRGDINKDENKETGCQSKRAAVVWKLLFLASFPQSRRVTPTCCRETEVHASFQVRWSRARAHLSQYRYHRGPRPLCGGSGGAFREVRSLTFEWS